MARSPSVRAAAMRHIPLDPFSFPHSIIPSRIVLDAVKSVPKYPLSRRAQVDCFDCGLVGVDGAKAIIEYITDRKHVRELQLAFNNLGDAGCSHLFSFLCSSAGRPHPITVINLNKTGLGDASLYAISEYVRGNTVLESLILSNNNLEGSPDATTVFATALSSSVLNNLSLSTNLFSSRTFPREFLAHLHAPRLRDLEISSAHLSTRASRCLAAFIASPRCRLFTLKASANNLGLTGVRRIVHAIERGGWGGFMRVELYSNRMGDGVDHTDSEEEDQDSEEDEEVQEEISTFTGGWEEVERRLRQALFRNQLRKKMVEIEAMALLRSSRIVLLQARPSEDNKPNRACPIPLTWNGSSSESALAPSLHSLPIEIKLHILSFLAPSLTPAQRLRVFEYSATRPTAQPLRRTLPVTPIPLWTVRTRCIADPSALGGGSGCANGKCMGSGRSMVCRREEERAAWLEVVGCSEYEKQESMH